ncbi:MAG: hypothetical protein L6R38_008449 [Xanthoria sp. 2 TBL-2021]|nr:MAG: hypothetical protein L6R38_008449 [Xanthoria sp. 2 TBL-2021]
MSAEPNSFKQIGLTRLLTDHVTFAIIADVYVLPEERGKGLGRWLLQFVEDVLKPKDNTLRRAILFCNEGPLEQFYEKELGMTRWALEPVGVYYVWTRGRQGYGVLRVNILDADRQAKPMRHMARFHTSSKGSIDAKVQKTRLGSRQTDP